MIFIYEGPDNVGKTTQIQYLKDYIEKDLQQMAHVMHYSNIKGRNLESRSKEYYNEMFGISKFASNNGINLILDRAHGGETVYSPIYRGYAGDYVYDLEKSYNGKVLNNMILIVFIDDDENLVDREDGESFSNDPTIKKQEIANFIKFYENSNIKKKLLINIKDKSKEVVWEEIKNYLEREWLQK